MITKFVIYLTLKCHRYLYKNRIELNPPSDDDLNIDLTIDELYSQEQDLSQIRLEIINSFNALFTSVEDTYLTMLATHKDQALLSTMTESWYKRSNDLNDQFRKQNTILTTIHNLKNDLQEIKNG